MHGLSLVVVLLLAGAAGKPSRPPEKGCAWHKLADQRLGLEAWVQSCDYGFRKIDFSLRGTSIAMKYSDAPEPEPVVDVLDLEAGETAEAGLRRIFAARTDKAVAARCVLAPFREIKAPPGVKRWTFAPDTAYAKELAAKAKPDEIPDPACGDWGEMPDGIQYFETQAGARKVLFVRVGQDTPLFDENGLRLVPAPGGR